MRKLIFFVITIAALAGLWVSFKPQPIPPNQVDPAVQQTPTQATSAPFVFEISNGEVKGPETFKVRQGDAVDIRITSDKADEAHLHGYDLHVELRSGVAAQLLFTAVKSGRFELELHGAHQTIGALEVYPAP